MVPTANAVHASLTAASSCWSGTSRCNMELHHQPCSALKHSSRAKAHARAHLGRCCHTDLVSGWGVTPRYKSHLLPELLHCIPVMLCMHERQFGHWSSPAVAGGCRLYMHGQLHACIRVTGAGRRHCVGRVDAGSAANTRWQRMRLHWLVRPRHVLVTKYKTCMLV